MVTGTGKYGKSGAVFKPSLQIILPQQGQYGVPLFTELHWVASQRVANFAMLTNIKGQWRVEDGNKVIFIPARVFPPSSRVRVRAKVKSVTGIWSEPALMNFSTADWRDLTWVEVDLHGINTVTVYKGAYPVRTMLASGGAPGAETPTGLFYIQDRGDNFWSSYYREGARYWVRITGEYLFHSVPYDGRWQFKNEEHNRLGEAASHGCIRLSLQDARWFYENIPWGTIVIIHK